MHLNRLNTVEWLEVSMFPKDSLERRRALAAALFAGFIAGLMLTVMHAAQAWAMGGDVWLSMKGAATPFFGERASQPGFDVVVIAGLACHFAVSLAWAIPFGLFAWGLSQGATIIAGAAYGLVVWFGMMYVVLPLVGMGEARHAMPIGAQLATHVLYGIAVAGVFLGYEREHTPGDRWYRARGSTSSRPAYV